jgi:hypothetical protein
MAIIAGCAAVLGLAKWVLPDHQQRNATPSANSQIIIGDIY